MTEKEYFITKELYVRKNKHYQRFVTKDKVVVKTMKTYTFIGPIHCIYDDRLEMIIDDCTVSIPYLAIKSINLDDDKEW